MATEWQEFLEREATAVAVGGNEPFSLGEADAVWVVCAGKVDVFSCPRANGEVSGARRHLLRIEAGQAVFGLDLGRGGEGLDVVGVAAAGTRLARLARSRLQTITTEPSLRHEAGRLLAEWVLALAAGLRAQLPPKGAVLLSPGSDCPLEAGASARVGRSVLWVRHEDGHSHFLGQTDLATVNGDLLFPVGGAVWLTAGAESRIACLETDDAVAQEASWLGLDQFHELVLRRLGQEHADESAAREQRLRAKADLERAQVSRGLGALASVLESQAPRARVDGASEPLLAACRQVGAAMGIEIRPPARATGSDFTAEDVARASRARLRRVGLRGNWWRQDSGALVGYIAEPRRPVALIPRSPDSYELHDSTTGERTRVTGAVASRLEPFGELFYRPLPPRPLKPRDLIAFCFHGALPDLVRVFVAGLVVGLLALVPPIATGILFDSVIPGAQRWQLVQLCLGLVVAGLSALLIQVVRGLALLRLRGRMGAALEAAMWDRLLTLPSQFYRNYSAGDLGDRAMGITAIEHALTGTVLSTLLTGVFSLLNLILLFSYSWQLALLTVALVVLAVTVSLVFTLVQVRQQDQLLAVHGRISSLLLQILGGIAKLRVAGAEGRAFARWAEAFAEQRRVTLRSRGNANLLTVFYVLFPVLCSIVLYTAVISFAHGMRTGTFLAFSAAFGGFLGATLGLAGTMLSIVYILPTYERMRPILEARPEVDEQRAHPGQLTGDIEVSAVTFRYAADGPEILAGVGLRFQPGQFVALVGASGSGKSTLLRLLLGFEKPESGTVAYDGKDLATLDLREVRRQIGVVLQSGRLLPGSILENILGSFPLTVDDAWEAARMAGLDRDLEQMPMGMQTVISEGASTLSGGQRQRLLIARAIVNRPRILFFDEATSALDNQTQAIVSRSLEQLQCTRVVIAHRLSTIVNADRIYVLDRGKVSQSGNYQELMAQPGLFAELARRQVV